MSRRPRVLLSLATSYMRESVYSFSSYPLTPKIAGTIRRTAHRSDSRNSTGNHERARFADVGSSAPTSPPTPGRIARSLGCQHCLPDRFIFREQPGTCGKIREAAGARGTVVLVCSRLFTALGTARGPQK